MKYIERRYWEANIEKYRSMGVKISKNMIYRILVVAINLVTGIIMSRDLLEANRGIFQLFITSLTWFNIFLNLGFNNSAVYFAGKGRERLHTFLSTNIFITLGSVILIGIVLYVYGAKFNFHSQELKYIFIICYVTYSFQLIFRSFLLGINEFEFSQKLDCFTRIIYLVFILILHFTDHMTLLNILAFLTLEYLVYTYFSYKKVNIKILPLTCDIGFLKETFFLNSKTYINAILYIGIMRGDQYLIKYFLGNYNVGLYSIGSLILENMGVLAGLVSVFYLPKLFLSDDLNEILKKSKKIILFLFGSSTAMAFVMYFLAPYVVELYFKHPSLVATQALQILLIGFIPWTIFIFINLIYLSIRFKKSILIIQFICLFTNMAINIYYLPIYGIIAAAWASSICYSILTILSYIDLFVLKKNNFLKKTSQ